MGARILYRDSQGRDGEVKLDPGVPCYVGRALECAIRTDDAMVSRKHSAIRMEGNRYIVEDLGSSNGTHVNNTRVTKQVLNHNDVVQCGSMWLRYVEDGPLVGAQPQAQPQPAPGRVGGTARLDAAQVPGHPGQYQQPAQVAQPAQPYQPPQQAQQPAMPQPYKPQPYQAPGQGAVDVNARTGYGGPQVVAGAAAVQPVPKGPPSLPPPDARAEAQESSVVVDMADPEEVRRAKEMAERVQRDMDELRTAYDREVADGKRMRAESSTLRDRIEELRRSIADRDEQVVAHQRVAEELRAELGQTKGELNQTRGELAETAENVNARERQLNRAQDDVSKLKEEIDDLKRQLVEVSKTKDEGWRKLNEQLGEIEHLREVINEQERMLEERRVGLVSQEQVIKELRAAKEVTIKDMATLRAERDEQSINAGRYQAQIQAIDEENRRLSRLLVDSQSGKGGSTEDANHTLKLADELKEMRVNLRKLESDRDRVQESADRNEKQVDKLDRQVAQLEIDLREASDRRDKAESAKAVAEEAMTKAEVARHKAAEEALEAAKARDAAMSSADEARRELDRTKRRVKELEAGGGAAAAGADTAELTAKISKLEREVKTAQDEKADAERGVKRIEAELELARQDAKHARAELEAAQLLGGDAAAVSAGGDNVDGAQVAAKATEVHDGINDVLSELRNNIVLIQNEFAEMAKEDSGDSARIIRETLEALLGNAEDAKGVLRSLKELVEYGN
jgi:hypothetical protein